MVANASISGSETNTSVQSGIGAQEQGIKFVKAVVEFSLGKEMTFVRQSAEATFSLTKAMSATDPKKAAIIITSVAVQKAMLVAGLTTKEETRKCVEAVGSLATNFALAAALAPTTLGIGAVLPLVLTAIDSYNVGTACFMRNDRTPATHSISEETRSVFESSFRSGEHGPI